MRVNIATRAALPMATQLHYGDRGSDSRKLLFGVGAPGGDFSDNQLSESTRHGGAPKGSSANGKGATTGDYNYNTTCDWWHSEDCNLIRMHVRPRLQLFTPFGTKGSPPARGLHSVRVTEGTFVSSGKCFRVVDSWKTRSTAHDELSETWVGTTRFYTRPCN